MEGAILAQQSRSYRDWTSRAGEWRFSPAASVALRDFTQNRSRTAAAIQILYLRLSLATGTGFARLPALLLALDQFCPSAQLFSPRLCATFRWKPKYEDVHKIEDDIRSRTGDFQDR
jgi:hypothetical protein